MQPKLQGNLQAPYVHSAHYYMFAITTKILNVDGAIIDDFTIDDFTIDDFTIKYN